MKIAQVRTLSDGSRLEPLNSFRKYEKKPAGLQRGLARQIRFSANWQKQKLKVQRLHATVAPVRADYLHKASTAMSKKHALVVMEDLQTRNMPGSATGSVEAPGRNVRAKSGLNKSILDRGWYEFRRQLGYKLSWMRGELILVPPQYTSQRCSACGFEDAGNRTRRTRFAYLQCGHIVHADHTASLNILEARHAIAVSTCGVGKSSGAHCKAEICLRAYREVLPSREPPPFREGGDVNVSNVFL